MAGWGRRRVASGWSGSRLGLSLVAVVAALVVGAVAPAGAGAVGPGGARVKVIVTFDAPPGPAARRAVEALGGTVRRSIWLIDGLVLDLPEPAIAALSRNPLVRSVERDATVRASEPTSQAASTGDLEYDNAWGVTHVGSKAVHDAGIWGQGVSVAVIDTGIDYIHDDPDDTPYVVDPEFNSNYRGGYDFFNDDADPLDDNGHGTHVAGILAAEKNGYLVVGVAPQVDLYALKILGASGEGDVSDLILALQWAVDNSIDVANMSLGTHEVSPALELAVQNAAAAGLLMVAASGNTVTFEELLYGCPVAYPGAYPEVLSTTFTNPNDALTGYSCTGPEVDFGSPGDGIFSPVPIGSCMFCSPYGYAAESGTSMASPHLAGAVALLLSAGLTDGGSAGLFDDVRGRLCATANLGWGVQTGFGGGTPIPPSDPRYAQYFGCGIVDAAEAVLTIAPPPINMPPVARADDLPVGEDAPADLAVLANDTDPDGDGLTVTSASDAPHGTTLVNPDGTVHYAPDANFSGDDSFGYTISDGRGGSDTAPVKVRVQAAPDPPIAVDDTATTSEDTATDIAVLANDSDPDGDALSISGVGAAVNGTPTINLDGTVHFVPVPNVAGDAYFEYAVSDGQGGADSARVFVSLTPVNDPPVAVNDSASTAAGAPVTVNVLVNDTDVEGSGLSVASASDPPHGVVTTNANGTITYTPDPGYSGADAFGYAASDGLATSNLATVSITVSPPSPPNPSHVGDLDRSTAASGKTWTAKVTIRIDTAAHAPVGGVTVSGSWSNGASGTTSCRTGSNGTCTVQVGKLSRATVAAVTFTVNGASRSGWTYTPAANHDLEGDSDGTTIVVLRPN